MSLCLQCDLVVHPTSGPGWERFMIYEQRVRVRRATACPVFPPHPPHTEKRNQFVITRCLRLPCVPDLSPVPPSFRNNSSHLHQLPKSAVDGKCGGCAGKCKQCRKAWDEAQSLPAQHRPASPCVTPERRAKHGSAVEWARPSPHYSGMDVLDGQNSSGNHSPTSSDLSCNIRPRRSAGKTKTKSTTATDIDPAEARSARGGGGECGKRALGDVESKPLALNKMARVSPREAAGGFSQSEAEPAVITRVDLVGCE